MESLSWSGSFTTMDWDPAIVVLTPAAPHYDLLRRALDQLTGHAGQQVPGALVWDLQNLGR